MAKATKKAAPKKRTVRKEEPLKVKEGSFLDIINASMKHANDHSAKPAEKKKA